MAVVAIGYFFTGYQKLVTSGWEWITTDNMRWVMYRAANIYSGHATGVARWIADRPVLCHAIAALTIVVECGAPLALAFPRLRVPFVLAATAFHTSIWVFLGLDYSMWIAIVWVVFIDWERVADTMQRVRGATRSPRPARVTPRAPPSCPGTERAATSSRPSYAPAPRPPRPPVAPPPSPR
jgi:hypothetical protein